MEIKFTLSTPKNLVGIYGKSHSRQIDTAHKKSSKHRVILLLFQP